MIFDKDICVKIHLEPSSNVVLPSLACLSNDYLNVNVWEIFAAIFWCGTSPIEWISQSSFRRIEELKYKIAIVNFALAIEDGYLTWNKEGIERLEQSERNVIYYYIGMFMTTIVSYKVYGVRYLVHFKKFVNENNCKTYKGVKPVKRHKEPDFVAIMKNGQIFGIFEAKGGRSIVKGTIRKAMAQLTCVKTIFGVNPGERKLCYAYRDTATIANVSNPLLTVFVDSAVQPNQQGYDINGENLYKPNNVILELTNEIHDYLRGEMLGKIPGIGNVLILGNRLRIIVDSTEDIAIEIISGDDGGFTITKYIESRDTGLIAEKETVAKLNEY